MKILNWIHRRLHHKCDDHVKKVEVTGNGKDNLSLLEDAGMDSAFDGWKEGILSIGTFGFDPSSMVKEFEDDDDGDLYSPKELAVDDGGDDDQEKEIEVPLVFKACKHGFFHDDDDDQNRQCDEISEVINDHEIKEVDVHETDVIKKAKKGGGERITLADLFSADSDKNLYDKKLTVEDEVKVNESPDSTIKHASYDDRVALINKKKITKTDAARAIKKINRMVRKMLKKKIHPDIQNQKDKCVTEAEMRTWVS